MNDFMHQALQSGMNWPTSFAIVGLAFAFVAFVWILAKY